VWPTIQDPEVLKQLRCREGPFEAVAATPKFYNRDKPVFAGRIGDTMADQLTEFLRSKKEQSTRGEVDWEAKKAQWLTSLQRLYARIKDLMDESIRDGTVDVVEFEAEVNEDYIGTYPAPQLKLTVGRDRVVFSPKGVNVIGAEGRVDLQGDRDTVTLIRTAGAGDREWEVVLQRVPKLVAVPLDESSLAAALQHVMLT
jgi:hypothetical protein